MTDTFIGIDLGTTYCSAAAYKNGKVEIIEFNGKNAFPSYVFYAHPNQYGFTARENLKNPEYRKSVVYDSKRMLGKTYKDLENEIPTWTFDVKSDSNGNPIIPIDNGKMLIKVKPCEVSASILNYIRETLLKKNYPLDHVVVTVPAHFTQKQLDEVRNAVRIAQFPNPEKIFLFKEPSAAALCFTNSISLDKERTVLVYDFGGGTFDLSLVKISPDQIEVIDQDGDAHLGGRDIDNGIFQKAIEYIKKQYPKIDIESIKGSLVEESERVKQSIATTKQSATIAINQGGTLIEYKLMRSTFENIVDPLVKRTIQIVKNLINSHKEVKVEYILLVGGTSLIYYVKQALEDEFSSNQIKVLNSVDPLTAVAVGAAQKSFFEFVQSQRNTRGIEPIVPRSFPKKMIEAVSITYGFKAFHEDHHPYFCHMIKKGTKLPSEPISKITWASHDNQSRISYLILQGESLEDSREIGEYSVRGLSGCKKAGEEKVKVTFQVDEQNCLHIKFQKLFIENAKEELMDIDVNKFLPSIEVENDLTKMSNEQIEESRARLGVNARNLDEELGELESKFTTYRNRARKNSNPSAIKYCTQQLELIQEAFYIDNEDESKMQTVDKIKRSLQSFQQQYSYFCN